MIKTDLPLIIRNGSRETLPVIEEQLLARLDESFGKYSDAVVAVNHHDFGVAVGIDRVVGESDLVALPRGVHNKIWNSEQVNRCRLA